MVFMVVNIASQQFLEKLWQFCIQVKNLTFIFGVKLDLFFLMLLVSLNHYTLEIISISP